MLWQIIKITSTPKGEAPEWVRKAWIGIELPCLGYDSSEFSREVLTGKKENLEFAEKVFIVSKLHAFNELAKVNMEAYRWWGENAPMNNPRETFSFDEGCVEEITPIPPIVEFVSEVERLEKEAAIRN